MLTVDLDFSYQNRFHSFLAEMALVGSQQEEQIFLHSQQPPSSLDVEKGKFVLPKGHSRNKSAWNQQLGRGWIKELLPLAAVVVVQLTLSACCLIFYDHLYHASPGGAAALVSCSLAGLSQGLLQLFVTRKLTPSKLIKFYTWGIISGVWTKFWTDQLSLKIQSPGFKVFWDQTIGTPISMFLFISFSAYWDGINVDRYLNTNYWKTLRASYVIWPASSTICFCVLPLEMIVPFNGVMNLVWTMILGLIS